MIKDRFMVYNTIVISKKDLELIKEAGFGSLQELVLYGIKQISDGKKKEKVKGGK